MQKYSRRCVIIFLLFLVFGLWPAAGYTEDKIIAAVNNDVITQSDLDEFTNYMRMQLSEHNSEDEVNIRIVGMKNDLLDRLIEDKLLIQEAKRIGVKVDADRIKYRIDQMKLRYRSDREFQEDLLKQGLAQSDLEARILDQLYMVNIIERMVKDKVTVLPEEVTEYYYRNIESYTIAEQREFEYFILSDPDLAKEIAEKLSINRDWNEVAKKYNLDINKHTGRQGGELRPEIEKAVFKLEKGQTSLPVEIQGKYYIFKLIDIYLYRQQSLLEVQSDIYAILQQMKMEQDMTKFLNDLKQKTYIKIY
ncbi:MAG: SurA N-terminal domain-containing protein [Candidatus Omnitrophota bacterium]|nr:SurA N-terminal domain-containing protein [Candidatus Omnitrophota bacterium]